MDFIDTLLVSMFQGFSVGAGKAGESSVKASAQELSADENIATLGLAPNDPFLLVRQVSLWQVHQPLASRACERIDVEINLIVEWPDCEGTNIVW
jgi:hypothetical protein